MTEGRPQPSPDPLIDEVRQARRALFDQFGNDLDAVCAHLRRIEQENPDRVVSLKARPQQLSQFAADV